MQFYAYALHITHSLKLDPFILSSIIFPLSVLNILFYAFRRWYQDFYTLLYVLSLTLITII